MKKRICLILTAVAMIGVFLISSITPSFVLSSAEQAESIVTNSDINSYSIYKSSYENFSFATTSATVEVGKLLAENTEEFSVNVPADGLYTIGMTYKALGEEIVDLEIEIKIDGAEPFSEAGGLSFPRFWKDNESARTDALGNEFSAEQVPCDDYFSYIAYDVTRQTFNPYFVFLSAGIHTVTVIPVEGSFELKTFEFGAYKEAKEYKAPDKSEKLYKGKSIIIEAEKTAYKNSYWLISRSDNASAYITPNNVSKSLLNYIGGGTWKAAGETITWETPELESGYYQLGFSYRQSTVIGGSAYRRLTVDGKVPFKEAESIGFSYDDHWQQSFFKDEEDRPYLIYLSDGKHEISLCAVPGEAEEVCQLIRESIAELNELYLKIMMITGEDVDTYRDYDLFAQISDMEDRLNRISNALNDSIKILAKINKQSTGSHISVLKNMLHAIELMLDNKAIAHRYISEYYDCYTSVASVLEELANVSLDIDKLSLTSVGAEAPFDKIGFINRISYSAQRFVVSFFQDYNGIFGDSESDKHITIWINWGRDQAQVFNNLVRSKFTSKTGISVNVKLVAASVVEGLISGNGPDCILRQSRSEPVNLAMRGSLYDLSQFDDLNSVLERFQDGAEIPYRYKDGIYALPDTQSFHVMFFRKDILEEMGLKVPETWDDFKSVAKYLARRNLCVYIPNNVATSAAEISAGIGSINIFPTLVLQKGLSMYSEDGRSTTLSNPEVMTAFIEWTDMYRNMGIPKSINFYNRFRMGICPLGIDSYALYTTLKAAAPEIDGLWDIALVPGTANENGKVSHTISGAGSACSILKSTENPEESWEFLKWWTEADTQLSYSNEVEALLGSTGRITVSNVEALKRMSWDGDMLDTILASWENVKEIPEYPGSYYLSRCIYQSYWNVVESNKNPKDVLLKYSKQANEEIERKWKQYE